MITNDWQRHASNAMMLASKSKGETEREILVDIACGFARLAEIKRMRSKPPPPCFELRYIRRQPM